MELLKRHTILKLEKLTNHSDNNFITYDKKNKKLIPHNELNRINSYFNGSEIDCSKNMILLYIKEQFEERVEDNALIKKAILSSTLSVRNDTQEKLLNFISLHPAINFSTDSEKIIDFIASVMNNNNEVQAKKYYNNIMKRLKYTCINILEKNQETRDENFAEGMKNHKKYKNETLVDKIEKMSLKERMEFF